MKKTLDFRIIEEPLADKLDTLLVILVIDNNVQYTRIVGKRLSDGFSVSFDVKGDKEVKVTLLHSVSGNGDLFWWKLKVGDDDKLYDTIKMETPRRFSFEVDI